MGCCIRPNCSETLNIGINRFLLSIAIMLEMVLMEEQLVAPCGAYCGTCMFLDRKEKPNCSGCGNQNGAPFWGKCKLYVCATGHVEHCGVCKDFLCDLFVDQFDPAHGQKSAFTRAGLLAYRRRVGTQKFIEMSEKLNKEDVRKK